jgi:hypothetical protein
LHKLPRLQFVVVYIVDAIELTTMDEVVVADVKLRVRRLQFGLMAKGGGSLLCRTVLVSNIPATMQEKDLKEHFTCIGGQIERYQPVPNSSSCLVTFTECTGIILVLYILFHLSILFKVNQVTCVVKAACK